MILYVVFLRNWYQILERVKNSITLFFVF
jgi:hypothetical protein